MPYNSEYGYIPDSNEELITKLLPYVNTEFGTTYTFSSFQGTNFYRFVYGVIQLIQENEVDTGEIYNKLQDYFRATNEEISEPKTPLEGLIGVFSDAGYDTGYDLDTAGLIDVAVDVDSSDPDYATLKQDIIDILALYTVAGMTFGGTETGTYTFTNGQAFTFGFFLPDEQTTELRVGITISDNNTSRIFSSQEVKDIIDANIAEKYQIGMDFEPEKYLSTCDLPFASDVLLEWTMNAGANWYSTVFDANFDDKVVYISDDTTVTIT